ncbi:MAG: DUF5674 family protein [Vicinamibacteria bacterium]|jgi:hypothetical protein|nr:DUF5674 family protein [Vicinamibacteria bacterium]
MRTANDTEPLSLEELRVLASNRFGDMVKGVVDIERGIVAVDEEMHADLEAMLLAAGSRQTDLWGINLYPDLPEDEWIEFDSLINIRPGQGNRSRSVEDGGTRARVLALIRKAVRR